MRLDYFIANASGLSRKDAKRALGAGDVSVDGKVCKQASYKLVPGESVRLRGESLTLPRERYLMLNKPEGVVCSTEDGDHLTVLSLIPAELRTGLHIVGRLDLDTTGLLLLTSDGQWSHRITSPRRRCPKTYRATLADAINDEALHQLRQGVMLKNDAKPATATEVRLLEDRVIELTITEGRYHQVKRMLAAVGNRVTALHRQSVGEIELDPALAPADYRELTEKEITSVGQLAGH